MDKNKLKIELILTFLMSSILTSKANKEINLNEVRNSNDNNA